MPDQFDPAFLDRCIAYMNSPQLTHDPAYRDVADWLWTIDGDPSIGALVWRARLADRFQLTTELDHGPTTNTGQSGSTLP